MRKALHNKRTRSMKNDRNTMKTENIRREDNLQPKTIPAYTFPDFLQTISAKYGNRTCYRIYNTNTSFTYNQIRDYADSISSYLISMGIMKGDRIAIIGEGSPMWMIMYLGIVSIGAIAVPILPDFPDCDVVENHLYL